MDIRQTSGWGNYLRAIGWEVKRLHGVQIFIKRVPLLRSSFIKIQHPDRPIPFKEIDQLAKEYQTLMILIEPSLKNYQNDDFIKNGFVKTKQPFVHTATIQIDLKPSLDKILTSFSENARRNIKKGISNNLKVEKVFLAKEKNLEKFQIFLKLLQNLTQMKKFWIPSDIEMKKKVAGLKDSVLLFAYEEKGKNPIAAVWLSLTKDSAHYIQTGITKKGYDLLANYVLVWEIIKLAKSLKLKIFDFEGIYDPRYPKNHPRWKNFSEFKSRFHGNKIEFPPPWVKFYNTYFKWFYLLGQKLP